jgi:hypothetical protein
MRCQPWRDTALGLIIAGFGMKIGMVPFNGWMPLTYSAAPIPAAALLSGAILLPRAFIRQSTMFQMGWDSANSLMGSGLWRSVRTSPLRCDGSIGLCPGCQRATASFWRRALSTAPEDWPNPRNV